MQIQYDSDNPEGQRWIFDPFWTKCILIAFLIMIAIACILPIFINM